MIDRRTTLGALAALGLAAPQAAHAADGDADVLQRHTQDLLDAIGTGSAAVWDRLLDPSFVLTDESGTLSGKADVVGGIAPLGPRIWGKLTVQDFVAHVSGDVAVATLVTDEQEGFYGTVVRCRYRTTDTWRRGDDGWRLIASQVLALLTDPPAITLPNAALREVTGKYALAPDKTMEIVLADGALSLIAPGRPPRAFRAEARDVLFVPGQPRFRYIVERTPDGRVLAIVQRREAWDLRWRRIA